MNDFAEIKSKNLALKI